MALQSFNYSKQWNFSAMTKTPAPHSAYRIFEDAFLLAGSFAKLGSTIAAHKIQSGAETANTYIHSKVDLTDMDARLASAAEGLSTASDYALHTDVKHMVDDVSAFARKHPVAAMISVIAVGALFSRMMMPATHVTTDVTATAATPKVSAKVTKLVVKDRAKANGSKPAQV
jgi:hypothetical protein